MMFRCCARHGFILLARFFRPVLVDGIQRFDAGTFLTYTGVMQVNAQMLRRCVILTIVVGFFFSDGSLLYAVVQEGGPELRMGPLPGSIIWTL